MKRVVLFVVFACLSISLAFPKYIGDVNDDGSITIADVTQLVNIILGKTTSYNKKLADVNEDGSITIADVTQLVNIILGKVEPKELVEQDTLFIYYANGSATYDLPSAWAEDVTVSISGGNVSVTNNNATTEYVTALSGTCDNGSFTYTGTFKTTLVLKGLTLTNPSGAAIDIQCGKRISLELAEGSVNTIADGTSGSQKAALYCKGHLEISKGGTLTVSGKKKHAISAKEYIEVKKTTGRITINESASDGIHCGQYFQMNGGNIFISGVAGDGIQAEITSDATDEMNGQMIIKGGTIGIDLQGNDVAGLKCDSLMTLSGGNITVISTGDDVKALKTDGDITMKDGTINVTQSGSYLVTSSMVDDEVVYDASYTTALKAGGNITIEGGSITVDNTADGGRGLNADGNINIEGGTLNIEANGNGGILETSGSEQTPTKTYKVFVALPTSSGGGFQPGGGGSNVWRNVYLYDSSDNLITQLTQSTSISVNGQTKTFYYYDFGQATTGTYYFKSDNYTSGGGYPGGGGSGTTYTIRTSNFNLNLSGTDVYYVIGGSYSTSSGTRTYSITDQTSTYSGGSTATEEGDTYKAFCLKSDGDITISDGTLTLSHSGLSSKGLKADGKLQIDGGTVTDTPAGGYIVVESAPTYCTAFKCQDFVGNGGETTITATGPASRGISADGTLIINDGSYDITLSGDGSTHTGNGETEGIGSRGLTSDGNMTLAGGTITINSTAAGGKGMKVGKSTMASSLIIGNASTNNGPTLTISTSGNYLSKSGSGMEESYIGSTKAVKCMGAITVNGGNISLNTQKEGAEGLESKSTITFNGGTFESSTYDDAINAASTITFNNGNVWAHASNNDAIDSNSRSGVNGIVINGGVVIGSATNSPEEAFDCDNANFIVNGGVVIGTGGSQGGGGGGQSSGGTPTSASQAFATVSSVSLTSGYYISIKNQSGEVLASYKMPRANSSATILVSHPQFTNNGSATVVYNSTSISGGSNSLWNGVYTTGATPSGGTSRSVTTTTK